MPGLISKAHWDHTLPLRDGETNLKTGHRGRHRSPRQRRSTAPATFGALAVVGASLLTWALLNQQGDPPTPQAGNGLQAVAQTDPPVATAAPESPLTQHSDASVADAAADREAGREPMAAAADSASTPAPEVQALPPSMPESVHIPAIEVSSPVHHLGLNDDGTLAVPSGERYDEAAWYDGSPTPGEIGPSVIEGHVTSQGSTPSVFFELGALQTGDTIEVTRQDGTVVNFEVYATSSFPKDDFPTKAVYGNTDVPELRLITCGGDYDTQARAHMSNIVVFAMITEQEA